MHKKFADFGWHFSYRGSFGFKSFLADPYLSHGLVPLELDTHHD